MGEYRLCQKKKLLIVTAQILTAISNSNRKETSAEVWSLDFISNGYAPVLLLYVDRGHFHHIPPSHLIYIFTCMLCMCSLVGILLNCFRFTHSRLSSLQLFAACKHAQMNTALRVSYWVKELLWSTAADSGWPRADISVHILPDLGAGWPVLGLSCFQQPFVTN